MATLAIDLTKPQFDQSSYLGRAKHFFKLTNPMNVFANDAQLDEAKEIVEAFKKSNRMPPGYDEAKLWQMKYLYDSAFHPDTGEKMVTICRMAAQAPMNTLITGCMITFYRTNTQTIFWQWINQTFNAGVNYTNRSGNTPISTTRLAASYVCACGGALGTALYLNSKVKTMKPFYARLVPFAAVTGANFVNIPMMRSSELANGAACFTKDGQYVGESRIAAIKGISLVCVSRVLMALPGMTLTPLITSIAASKGLFHRFPRAELPLQTLMVAICVSLATPLCCALFSQQASIGLGIMETELAEKVRKSHPDVTELYFNKGL